MKKFFIGFLLTAVFFISANIVYSAAITVPKQAMQWHCLERTQIAGHTVDLTTKAGDLPNANEKTYITVCMSTELGNVCTTGDSNLDLQTLGYDGVAKLKQSTATGGDYQQQEFLFNGKPVPKDSIVANSQGKLTAPIGEQQSLKLIKEVYAVATGKNYQVVEPIRWTDYTPKGVGRKWLALNLLEPVKIEMGQGGQQQGTITLSGALSRCIPISWDPYGIVFDSQSLEPVAGIKVSLMKKDTVTGAYTLVGGEEFGSLLNPISTVEDGAFSFFVPDGTYRLDISALNFSFPNVAAKLNTNYAKVYSDIYRGEDIIQKGAIQHRDIPIDSKTTPYVAPVKLVSYFPLLDKGADMFIVQGRVSHPLITINVYGKKPDANKNFIKTRLLLTTEANKMGQFEIRYDLTKLTPTEMVGDIELVKPDYSNLQVKAATTINPTFSVEPIPNYLEGYAYDKNGNVLANSTVGVYLTFSNKPAYETTTDEKGYFQIPSEYLPPFTYNIKYTSATGATTTSTVSNFIAQNADYIQTSKSNLYAFKNKKGQVFQAQHEQLTQPVMPTAPAKEKPTTFLAGLSSNMTLLAAAILIILVIIATLFGISLLRKKQTPPLPPTPPVPPAAPTPPTAPPPTTSVS